MYGASAIVLKVNKMKTIRIRKFTILSLFLILTLPWLFYVAAHFMETKTVRLGMDDSQKENLEATIHLIETNTDKWTDPAWQEQLSRQLEKINMDVSILSDSNQEIFRTNSEREPSFTRAEHFSIIQDDQVLGRVAMYQANSKVTQMIAAFVGLISAFLLSDMPFENIFSYLWRKRANVLGRLQKEIWMSSYLHPGSQKSLRFMTDLK